MIRYVQKDVKSSSKDDLESLINIGKIIANKLRKIGIKTAAQFLKKDPYSIYHTLQKEVDPSLCRCALASIVGAKKGVKWHTITRQSAKEYLKRYPDHQWGNKC